MGYYSVRFAPSVYGVDTKRPITKRPITKRPITKHPNYKTSKLQNVQSYKTSKLQNVQVTKRPMLQNVQSYTYREKTSNLCFSLFSCHILCKHCFKLFYQILLSLYISIILYISLLYWNILSIWFEIINEMLQIFMVNPPVKYRKSAIFLRHLSTMAGNTDMCPAKFITSQKNQPILVDGFNYEYRKKSKVGSTTYWQRYIINCMYFIVI